MRAPSTKSFTVPEPSKFVCSAGFVIIEKTKSLGKGAIMETETFLDDGTSGSLLISKNFSKCFVQMSMLEYETVT